MQIVRRLKQSVSLESKKSVGTSAIAGGFEEKKSIEMKAKMKAQPDPASVVAAVTKGEAELGVFLVNVLTAPGLDVVGPFPAEVQENLVYTAAVASEAREAAAARILVEYLKSPAAVKVIQSKGMSPS